MACKLYSYQFSGNAYKPRLLASLLNIPLDIEQVNITEGKQRSPEYLAINPHGTVPTLVDQSSGDSYTDSAAILTFLASAYSDDGSRPGPSSLAALGDPAEQAQIVEWLVFAGRALEPLVQRRLIWSILIPAKGNSPELQKKMEEHRQPAYTALDLLELRLKKNHWLAAGRLTIADVACFPYVALAPMGDISLESYPSTNAWISRIRGLPRYLDFQGIDDPLFMRRAKGL